MIPPKKWTEEQWADPYSRHESTGPEEKERLHKKLARDQEILRRRKTTEKIKPGDLIEYNVGGGRSYVGLVLETKHEEHINHDAAEHGNEITKFAKIQWSQKIPSDSGVPVNEDWWFSLKRGYWKLLNRQ